MITTHSPASAWTFSGCPAPPVWALDWPGLREQFAFLAPLAGCPQDPIYHAEGDVLIHTGMVCAALAGHPAWRGLPEADRAVLFAAALLHDIGKPARTVIADDGRISSRGHARLGAAMARRILYRDPPGEIAPPPFAVREAVVALVRHHSLPLYFLDGRDPRRAVIVASQVVSLEQLALLAEADVLGRECEGKDELLARINLFRDYCREQGCLRGPRLFPSSLARFRYLHTEGADPDYAPYDQRRCEVTLLAGLPAAGKDTWLRRHGQGCPIVSLDALRADLDIAPAARQGPVIEAAMAQARSYLRAGHSFIWNATNLRRSTRARLINLFLDYGAYVRIVYLEAPWAKVLHRNAARPAPVPDGVLWRMAGDLEVPDVTEAHEVEWIDTSD